MAARKKSSPTARPRFAAGSARVRDAIRAQQRRIAAATTVAGATSVEDIHGSRVAARRLRSMLRTFRPLLDADRARHYRADLRSFASALGAAREADVRRELLIELSEDAVRIPPAMQRRLAVLLEDACIAARENLNRHFVEPQWAALCAALERQRGGETLVVERTAGLPEVMELVSRAWRRPVRILRRRPTSTAELHELRLAFKHCRYALETVADVAPKETSRLLRRLRAAQDRIGDHRDTVLAEHWVRESERALGRALVARLGQALARREAALRRESARRAARVLEAWEAWRVATRSVRKGASPGRA